jgi:hypothetical protein
MEGGGNQPIDGCIVGHACARNGRQPSSWSPLPGTCTMRPMAENRDEALEVGEDLVFQERSWVVQRVG